VKINNVKEKNRVSDFASFMNNPPVILD